MAADPAQPTPAAARRALARTESTMPHLSRRSFLLALGITLAIFFGLNPLWRPIDMDAMDRNIGWSYAPIPLLVWGLLALERKLRWSTWALDTVKLTLVKFAITFLFANTMWAFVGPPRRPEPQKLPAAGAAAPVEPGRFDLHEPPPPTPIDPARAGRLQGLIVDAAGAPQAGVLVAVTGGLDGIVFAPDPDGVVLSHDERGLQPPRAVVLVHERLVLRGAADQLHTASAFDVSGRQLFNVPLLPGAEHALMFDQPLGRVPLKCSVHGQAEHEAELVVVGNPFAAWTGQDGRFAFEGVPAGDLEVTAWGASGGSSQASVSLEPRGAEDDLRIVLP